MTANTIFHLLPRSTRAGLGAAASLPISLTLPLSTRLIPPLMALMALIAVLTLAGCTVPLQPGIIPASLFLPPDAQPAEAAAATAARRDKPTAYSDTPKLPKAARLSTVQPALPQAKAEAADTTLSFDQLPLPSFVNVVFGTILKKNFSVDPAVMVKADLVTLRVGAPQTRDEVLNTATMLLKTYGIAVTELGGFYRIAPDSNLSAYAPEIRRGRALPDVPLPLRPVFNLIEMSAVRAGDVSAWLKAMFGAKLNVQDDSTRNALLLSGQAADISAALEAIQVLDQPLMRGRNSQLVTPGSLSADDLSRKLIEILSTEGYAATVGAGAGFPISLVSIPASNSLLVFAVDPAVLAHVVAWAAKLDALDNDNRRTGNLFSYKVRYTDAQGLARTMQELLVANSLPVNPGAMGVVAKPPGRIVVNAATNTLIFTSSQSDYAQLLSIMKDLDQPAKSALIEVTVAEVRVSDQQQLGIDWSLPGATVDGRRVAGGTLGGVGLATGGFSMSFLNNAGVVRANLNALASANRANILSTPRVMARNGESATIQVGQEVPIVTSQQSSGITNANTTGGASVAAPGVLQTIQYRNTGVILKVKPVIFAGNRIELEIAQEVSTAGATTTGVTSSPTFSSRKLETKLSIRDGATVLLGGLISSNDNTGNTGVPLLKDLPGIGQLFRSNNDSRDKTELIVLITPYVIDDDLVAEQVTAAFRKQIGPWAADASGQGQVLKLRPVPPPLAAPAAVPPAAAAPAALAAPASDSAEPTPADALDHKPAAKPSPPLGKPVTDPALLEEFRKAGAALPTKEPGTPALPKKPGK